MSCLFGRSVRSMILVGAVSLWCADTAPAQCLEWFPGEAGAITNGDFRASVMFDPDGSGPAAAELVVGGDFSGLPGPLGPTLRDLARWDGVQWGAILPGTQRAPVRAMVVFDFDGEGPNPPRLVFGGQFSLFVPRLENVGVWNGQSLEPLGAGFTGPVNALLVHDADGPGPGPAELYAAGQFSSSGGVSMPSRVARWTGTAWESAGAGLSVSTINTLASFDLDGPGPAGNFVIAGGLCSVGGQVSNAAILSAGEWYNTGSGLNGEVRSLAMFDFDEEGPEPTRLLACGTFENSGPVGGLRGQAYFDGTRWRSIAPLHPSGVASRGRCFGVVDPDGPGGEAARLYLAGMLRVPGDSNTYAIVQYEQGGWSPVLTQSFSGEIFSMMQSVLPGESSAVLVLAGTLALNSPPRQLRVATLDDGGVEPLGAGLSSAIVAMTVATVDGERRVVASGGFGGLPGVGFAGVAAFDGESWSPVGSGPFEGGGPASLHAHDPDGDGPEPEFIVAGGSFTGAPGGVAAQNVARWNGESWEAMGTGIASFPSDFTSFDSDGDGPAPSVLLAAGGGVSGGPGSPSFVFQWDGERWTQFGPSFISTNGPAQVGYLTTFDRDGTGPAPRELVVVGFFSRVGTTNVSNAAVFDGKQWRPMGSGFNTNPQRAFTWDRLGDGNEVVVVCGGFTTAGGVPARGTAVWNGSAWSALGSGFGQSDAGSILYPRSLTVFDADGAGPAPELLYAAGGFTVADGAPASGIARWNATRWEAVGAGLTPGSGSTLAVLAGSAGRSPRLCVGGAFSGAGGRASAYFAQYGVVRCCAADFNADGYVNSADLFEFLEAFFSVEPEADVNADGFVNTADFFEVLAGLFGGC